MNEKHEQQLLELQNACNAFVSNLDQDLDERTKAVAEQTIREFELSIHEGIARTRESYKQGVENAQSLPEFLQEKELERLDRNLERSIDSMLNLLTITKENIEAIMNS